MTAGYSGKTLAQKLGLGPGVRLAAINPPSGCAALIGGVAPMGGAEDADIVHVFVADAADLTRRAVGLTEDGIRQAILPTGSVDVKVCAVDADWSGLKFLRRRA